MVPGQGASLNESRIDKDFAGFLIRHDHHMANRVNHASDAWRVFFDNFATRASEAESYARRAVARRLANRTSE
jgi:hypothetical protein